MRPLITSVTAILNLIYLSRLIVELLGLLFPVIYQIAEQLAGVNPREILFIDDRQENVEGALKRGWRAAQCFGGPAAIEIVNRYLAIQ